MDSATLKLSRKSLAENTISIEVNFRDCSNITEYFPILFFLFHLFYGDVTCLLYNSGYQ
jgi:hypothetical protein